MKEQRSNALAEVYFVICNLNKEEYSKIPANIVEAIKKNMNLDYRFNINKDVSVKEQVFLMETKAILFNLFKNYLATPEQRKKIAIIEQREEEESEAYKRERYNSANLFKNS